MSLVTVNITCDSARVGSERRFDKGFTITTLKGKLEMITGAPAGHQELQLMDRDDKKIGVLAPDDALLGSFPVEDGMRIHVINTDPYKVVGQFDDVSKVEKFEITHDEYAARTDTVMQFKKRNKLGRFNPEIAAKIEEQQAAAEVRGKEKAETMKVGDRCQVESKTGVLLGTVKYVGKTGFKEGYWVGVQYDEPMGKHNGTVEGHSYFECPPKYGAMVRPGVVTVGDFPEEDFDLSSDDEM